jgi:multiple sugar transport system substrate-binding protein
MSGPLLRGITWNHSRALPPLVAAAQRFEELHSQANVRIVWEKRSLHEFGHASLAELARTFDLLVVDHPMMGEAYAGGLLTDLRPLLQPDQWNDLRSDSAGPSFESYLYEDKLYCLPIDAAAPAASYRPDLLAARDLSVPESWSDLLTCASEGLVRMPGFPADLFLNFMGLCVSRGSSVAAAPDLLLDPTVGLQRLEELRELACYMPAEIYGWNPIAVYEQMTSTDDFAYCPFAYTYNNYSRAGFAARLLRFAPPVTLSDGIPMRTVLGGTGLALSADCAFPELALEYSLYVAGRVCQSTLYGVCGGQPARRSAWQNEELNRLTDGFFQRTLSSVERAYVRPRYNGYVPFQEQAGVPIAHYLQKGGDARSALSAINSLYRASRESEAPHV